VQFVACGYSCWKEVTASGRRLQLLEGGYSSCNEATAPRRPRRKLQFIEGLEGRYSSWNEVTNPGKRLQHLEGGYSSWKEVTSPGRRLQILGGRYLSW
jgi:hypothetical protein